MRVEDIKKDIDKKVAQSVKSWQETVTDCASNYMNMFYSEYLPRFYHRTYTVRDSLEWYADKNYARVHFDISKQNHPTGSWSEEEIQDSVMTGATHGGAESGTPVWTSLSDTLFPPEELMIKILKEHGL